MIARALGAAALGLVTGCIADDALDVAVDEQESVLETTWRLPSTVDVCFVLDAVTTVTAADMNTIRTDIEQWTLGETALRFRWAPATFVTKPFSGVSYRTNCTQDWVGRFNQELRLYVDARPRPDSPVRLPDSLTIPNCSHHEPLGAQAYVDDPVTGTRWPVITPAGLWQAQWGFSWSMFSNEVVAETTCLYTTHLGPNQTRNHYLHEIGHALGFAHEQVHTDQDCEDPHAPWGTMLTNYDRDSVMHYAIPCNDGTVPVGAGGATGPSAGDQLAVEMMFPRTLQAGIVGNTVHWQPGSFRAYSEWVGRGAYVSGPPSDHALREFKWRVDGALISTGIEPTPTEWATVTPGSHTVSLEMRDLWGSLHTGSTSMELMPSQAAYLARVAATRIF